MVLSRIGSMKKLLFFILGLTFINAAWADETSNPQDSTKTYLHALRQLMESSDWYPSDSVYYRRFNILLGHLLDEELDNVVDSLTAAVNNKPIFFERDTSDIPNNVVIPGKLSQEFVNERLLQTEEKMKADYPMDSIDVPDQAYAGMYAKLDLVWSGEIESLFLDSLVNIPDTLRLSIKSDTSSMHLPVRNRIDSADFALLDSIRTQYNNELIKNYRDSVTVNYRLNFVNQKINEAKSALLDSVKMVNDRAIIEYNNHEVSQLNEWVWHNLNPVLERVKREPNQFTVYNYKNDSLELALRYDENWFKWFYLKNTQNDSIGIKIVNVDKDKIKIYVDESINLSRLVQKKRVDISNLKPETELLFELHKPVNQKIIENPWKLGGKAYAGFTQTYINSYWAKGGNTSASTLSTFNYYANFVKPKVKWENSADLKLGLVYYLPEDDVEQSEDSRNYHKNSDNIDLRSKLGISAFKNWYYSTAFEFKTQFFKGYKNKDATDPTSAFFAPAYLNFSIGLDYKPNKNLSVVLSPITLKTTIVKETDLIDETKYGLVEGETTKYRMGISGKVEHKRKLIEDVNIDTDNSIFINLSKNSDGEAMWYKFPDLDSETTIDFKVNQFISTQLNFHFIYDKDITSTWTDENDVEQKGTKLQVKEFITLGLTYKF